MWKTSSTAVHQFIQNLPFSVTDNYTELCQALVEEFSCTVVFASKAKVGATEPVNTNTKVANTYNCPKGGDKIPLSF